MVIARPVTKTKISTVGWGIPVTDAVNALETMPARVASLEAFKTFWTPTAWVAVTFQNGWASQSGYGPASYRKIGDVIYTRGLIWGGSASVSAFTLPAGFRPPYLLEIPTNAYVSGSTHTPTVVTIGTDGTVRPAITGSLSVNFTFAVT